MNKVSLKKYLKYILCVLLIATAVITLFYVFENYKKESGMDYQGKLSRFSYFTIQSNIIAAIWYIMLFTGMFLKSSARSFMHSKSMSLAVTDYITITGVIYWAVLVPINKGAAFLFTPSNIWLHTITPVASWIFYIFLVPKEKVKKRFFKDKKTWLLMIYPLVYMFYAIYKGVTIGNYIYPFLSPKFMGGVLGVIVAIISIAMFFLFVAFVLNKIKSHARVKMSRKDSRKKAA